MTENGGGKERKINGGLATANQVREGWKKLKHKYLQTESTIKTFYSRKLSEEPITKYSRSPEIMYSHSVHTECVYLISGKSQKKENSYR
jgi:hypothetical protein